MSELTKAAEGRGRDGWVAPRPMETHATSLRIIQGLDGLDELSEAWESFAAQASTPMLDHAWIRACAETFTVDGELHLLAVGASPHITAVAPLVRRRAVLERLELLGMNELREPLDFLFSHPSALALLANALASPPRAGSSPDGFARRGRIAKRLPTAWRCTLPPLGRLAVDSARYQLAPARTAHQFGSPFRPSASPTNRGQDGSSHG